MASRTPSYISAAALARELGREEWQIIDVRDEDFQGGHIPGARHCPSQAFARNVDYLAQEFASSGKTLVFHCMFSQSRGPGCARLFLRHLDEHYAERSCKVMILEGGFAGWEERFVGHPDEQRYIKDRPELPNLGPKNFYTMSTPSESACATEPT
eukprot:TRINITY_DN21742_c0_g1_i2.p1 TRINITY_DN21742_c0_g1~~TRINITY_DN21742_c0_g1_i2.p1  ORF type:complete len:176 (-),score=17.68 TRINITY_DN21742_c0_g1_i2:69-533(-)